MSLDMFTGVHVQVDRDVMYMCDTGLYLYTGTTTVST